MMPVGGRILPGLDEFMLRLGHLSVLMHLSVTQAIRPRRLESALGATLTRSVVVEGDHVGSVTEYLEAKNLCVVVKGPGPEDQGKRAKLRYPELTLRPDPMVEFKRLLEPPSPSIWWQDYCLASPEVESAVGAVTVDAKSGSSTGISHIINWASLLGLINKDMTASSEGRLLANLGSMAKGTDEANPYVLAVSDRILFAYLLLRVDIDLLSRFLSLLASAPYPIKKSQGARLFGQALELLIQDVEHDKKVSHRAQFHIMEQYKELKRAQKKSACDTLGGSSTAWHRASSRLECYVDLGLLVKRRERRSARFEYVYYGTDLLQAVTSSLSGSDVGPKWIEDHTVEFFGVPNGDNSSLDGAKLLELLLPVLAALGRPIGLFPIQSVSLGIAMQGSKQGRSLSISAAREAVLSFARSNPHVARLSRGAAGDSAEFVSFDAQGKL